MLDITRFKHKQQISLQHYGECYILGIDNTDNIYTEEYYENSYIAQHCITKSGLIIKTVDEDFGVVDLDPLPLAPDMIVADHPLEHPLNYTGLRFRGMREQEKVAEWMKLLSITEKLPLLQALQVDTPPMMILGIAESRVLAENRISESESLICRRIQLLRALAQIQYDEDHLPYDYDTITFYVLQAYDNETDTYTPLHEAIQHFSIVPQAMDCVLVDGDLIVANGSDSKQKNSVHVFQLTQIED